MADKTLRELEALKVQIENDIKAMHEMAPEGKARQDMARLRDQVLSSEGPGPVRNLPADFKKLAADIEMDRLKGNRKNEEAFKKLNKINSLFGEVSFFGQKRRSLKVPKWFAFLVVASLIAVFIYAALNSS